MNTKIFVNQKLTFASLEIYNGSVKKIESLVAGSAFSDESVLEDFVNETFSFN